MTRRHIFAAFTVNGMVADSNREYLVLDCPFGLVEIVVPVRRGNKHLATLSAGVWRRPELAVPECYARSKALADAYVRLVPLPPERAQALGTILANAGRGLLALAEGLQRIESQPRNRREEIFRFIALNAGGAGIDGPPGAEAASFAVAGGALGDGAVRRVLRRVGTAGATEAGKGAVALDGRADRRGSAEGGLRQ